MNFKKFPGDAGTAGSGPTLGTGTVRLLVVDAEGLLRRVTHLLLLTVESLGMGTLGMQRTEYKHNSHVCPDREEG